MKMIAIARSDGGVSVMHMRDDLDVDAQIDQWEQTAPADFLPILAHAVVSSLPDRNTRDRWILENGAVVVAPDPDEQPS